MTRNPRREYKNPLRSVKQTPVDKHCKKCIHVNIDVCDAPCSECHQKSEFIPKRQYRKDYAPKLTSYERATAKLESRHAKQLKKVEAKETRRLWRVAKKEAQQTAKAEAKEAKRIAKLKKANMVEIVDTFTQRSLENDIMITKLMQQFSAQAERLTIQDKQLKEQNQRIQNQFEYITQRTQPIDFDAEFTKWNMGKSETPVKDRGPCRCDASCKHSSHNNSKPCPWGAGGDMSCIKNGMMNGSKWEAYVEPEASVFTNSFGVELPIYCKGCHCVDNNTYKCQLSHGEKSVLKLGENVRKEAFAGLCTYRN